MELSKYYAANTIEGLSFTELQDILNDASYKDSVSYIDDEGTMMLAEGGSIECIASYYHVAGKKKVKGNKDNFALFCTKARKELGMDGWRSQGNCKECHLCAIEKLKTGILSRI